MKTEFTNRGFAFERFTDANGVECSLQESSAIAGEEGGALIWLGCNKIGVQRFDPGKGWSEVELQQDHPYGIIHTANNRMHLTQETVKTLIPALEYFVKHGTLPHDPT